jgi:hypothetical protein
MALRFAILRLAVLGDRMSPPPGGMRRSNGVLLLALAGQMLSVPDDLSRGVAMMVSSGRGSDRRTRLAGFGEWARPRCP